MFAGWTPIAVRIDHYAYDLMMSNLQPPESWTPQSVIVAIDEPTLGARGGMRNIRTILADLLDQIATAQPLAVASDVTLHDQEDAAQDQRLAASLHAIRNLILPCQIVGDQWEDPLPLFRAATVAVGHVHPEIERQDGVSRQLPLEITAGGKRRWALALEAFRVTRGQPIVESPEDVQIGDTVIPAPRGPAGRPMLIRYLRPGIPAVSG